MELNTALSTASSALDSAAASVAVIERDGTIDQLRAAGTKLSDMLNGAANTIGDERWFTSVAPDMLGASEVFAYGPPGTTFVSLPIGVCLETTTDGLGRSVTRRGYG